MRPDDQEIADFLVSRWESDSGRIAYKAIRESLIVGGSILGVLSFIPPADGAIGLDLRGFSIVGESVPDFGLDGCDLSYGSFENSVLHKVSLTNCRLDRCSFRNAELFGINGYGIAAGMIQARAIHAVFDHAQCQGLSMECGDFSFSSFCHANLRGAHMTNAKFEGAAFRGADLRGAKTSAAVFTGADFHGALR